MDELSTPKDNSCFVPERLRDGLSHLKLKLELFDDMFKAMHPGVQITDQRRRDMWNEVFREWDPYSPLPLTAPTPTRKYSMEEIGVEVGVFKPQATTPTKKRAADESQSSPAPKKD
ncbi:hypothetical protein FGRMN_10713 [Fusarium graminum]|nr:hypothetical protein FGRMN_10713 [Fusarium graminum]